MPRKDPITAARALLAAQPDPISEALALLAAAGCSDVSIKCTTRDGTKFTTPRPSSKRGRSFTIRAPKGGDLRGSPVLKSLLGTDLTE